MIGMLIAEPIKYKIGNLRVEEDLGQWSPAHGRAGDDGS